MNIYALINQKGGVGKTTLTTNISYGLAKLGKRVLVIDLDPQGHTTTVFGDQGAAHTVKELFEGAGASVAELAAPAIVNGEEVPGLDIVPSNIKLAVSAENLAARIHREKVLAKALAKVKNDYDYCLIDCPPTLGVLAVNGIYAADRFLVPVTYGRYALDGVADLFAIISTVREGEDFSYTIIRNGYDSRTTTTNDFIEDQLSPFNANVAATRIRKSESINQAAINGEPVFTFDQRSNGTVDFTALTAEIAGLEN